MNYTASRLGALALAAVVAHAPVAAAQGSKAIIRDAEIESLLREYAVPIFKAAGLTPGAVDVIIVNDSGINAFVTGGQRIFIHTGLLTEADTPNEVIGVLAHETGHISGGHLARSRDEIERASIASIVATIAGAAAIAGGMVAGSSDIAAAGRGVIQGGQGAAKRSFLKYARAQESAADQAAMRYLDDTGQSARGMLTLFSRLSDQMLVTIRNVDPYVLSHPLPRERIALLERLARESPYFDQPDPPSLQIRHDMMRAKLVAFLARSNSSARRFRQDPDGLPARYGRAISAYRTSDIERAIREIDSLIAEQPKYPYFWELKGQILLESRRTREAVSALERAVALAPSAALIRIMLAQAQLETGDPALLDPAIDNLTLAIGSETRSPIAYRQLAFAYDRKGDTARAELYSAREFLARGDLTQAKNLATRARDKFRRGTPEWLRADDIVNIQGR